MGSGVAPEAVLARDSPAAWCQARLALAVEALALGCSNGLWGVGVRHWAGEVIDNRHQVVDLEIPFFRELETCVISQKVQLSNRAN